MLVKLLPSCVIIGHSILYMYINIIEILCSMTIIIFLYRNNIYIPILTNFATFNNENVYKNIEVCFKSIIKIAS